MPAYCLLSCDSYIDISISKVFMSFITTLFFIRLAKFATILLGSVDVLLSAVLDYLFITICFAVSVSNIFLRNIF